MRSETSDGGTRRRTKAASDHTETGDQSPRSRCNLSCGQRAPYCERQAGDQTCILAGRSRSPRQASRGDPISPTQRSARDPYPSILPYIWFSTTFGGAKFSSERRKSGGHGGREEWQGMVKSSCRQAALSANQKYSAKLRLPRQPLPFSGVTEKANASAEFQPRRGPYRANPDLLR